MKRFIALLVVVVVAAVCVMAQDEPQLLVRNHGSLTANDNQIAGGRFVDWFMVTAPGDGQIVVTAVSLDFDPVVLFVSAGGREAEVEGQGASVRAYYAVEFGDRVEIGITESFVPSGNSLWTGEPVYIVDIEFSPGGGGLAIGTEIRGHLDKDDELGDRGGFIDWYPLEVPADKRVRVDVYSHDFDTYLIVELSNGEYLENDDSDGSDSSLSFTSNFGGTIRVGVTSFGSGEVGSYDLSVSSVAERFIGLGDIVDDYLDGDQLSYRVEAYPGDRIIVELSSYDFDTYLTVDDASGNYESNDDYGDSSDSRVIFLVGETGEAYITVSSWDDSGGDFTLSVDFHNVTVERPPEGYRLRDGDRITGELGPDMPINEGAYYQLFTFAANRGERLEILLESDDVDSYLRIVAPDGTVMTDDDGGGNYNSRLIYTVDRAGIYEVYATSLGLEEGLYTITFTKLGEGRLILRTDGDLTGDDEQDISGKIYDVYSFQASAGSLLIIDVISESFDTFAILRSRDGEILISDDDGGSDSNSRIEYTPNRTGTFELLVTSFTAGTTGSYSVTIYE